MAIIHRNSLKNNCESEGDKGKGKICSLSPSHSHSPSLFLNKIAVHRKNPIEPQDQNSLYL